MKFIQIVKMIHKNRYTSHQSYAFQTSRDPPLMPWQYWLHWQGTYGFLHFVDTICSRITFCNHESPMIHTLSFMPITTQHQMLCEIRTHIKYLSLGTSHTAKHQVECRGLNTWSETSNRINGFCISKSKLKKKSPQNWFISSRISLIKCKIHLKFIYHNIMTFSVFSDRVMKLNQSNEIRK